MKKLIILLFPLMMLVGCDETAVPVKVPFPNVPEEMLKACPDLAKVNPETTKLSDVIGVVTDNYATYYECKNQIDDWIEWYKTQKGIYSKL